MTSVRNCQIKLNLNMEFIPSSVLDDVARLEGKRPRSKKNRTPDDYAPRANVKYEGLVDSPTTTNFPSRGIEAQNLPVPHHGEELFPNGQKSSTRKDVALLRHTMLTLLNNIGITEDETLPYPTEMHEFRIHHLMQSKLFKQSRKFTTKSLMKSFTKSPSIWSREAIS